MKEVGQLPADERLLAQREFEKEFESALGRLSELGVNNTFSNDTSVRQIEKGVSVRRWYSEGTREGTGEVSSAMSNTPTEMVSTYFRAARQEVRLDGRLLSFYQGPDDLHETTLEGCSCVGFARNVIAYVRHDTLLRAQELVLGSRSMTTGFFMPAMFMV